MNQEKKIEQILNGLSKSTFRSRFKLKEKELNYIKEKGLEVIQSHANDFIKKRLSDAIPKNDGKQTPMKGHPVFIAEHATATCCRGCLSKWHHIPQGKELTKEQQQYIVEVIMTWIQRQMN